MTNSERRVTLVRKANRAAGRRAGGLARSSPGLRSALGFAEHFAWRSSRRGLRRVRRAAPPGARATRPGISHDRLEREGSLQWPCPSAGPSRAPAPIRRRSASHTRSGRAADRRRPCQESCPSSQTRSFPLILTSGRVASQWHTMTRTGKSRRLMAAERGAVSGAASEPTRAPPSVSDGSFAACAPAAAGPSLRVRIDDTLRRGNRVRAVHWGALHAPAGAGAVNNLTHRATDPVSRQPGLKAAAIRVEPVPGRPARRRAADCARGGARARARAVPAARRASAGRPGGRRHELRALHRQLRAGRLADHACGTRARACPTTAWRCRDHLAGQKTEEALRLRDDDWYRAARRSTLHSGDEVGRDGRRSAAWSTTRWRAAPCPTTRWCWPPARKPLRAADRGRGPRRGVRLSHAARMTRAILDAHGAACGAPRCIGGGLLGLEAARGPGSPEGCEVTVVHLVDRVMERQLDGPAAALRPAPLCAAWASTSLFAARDHRGARRPRRVKALRFAWGDDLRDGHGRDRRGHPSRRRACARRDGRRGRPRRSSSTTRCAPAHPACGRSASARSTAGQIQGLWAPISEQARVAGASVAGLPAAFHGAVPVTRLKVAEIELFCARRCARPRPTMTTRSSRWTPAAASTRKLVARAATASSARSSWGTPPSGRAWPSCCARGDPVPEALLGRGRDLRRRPGRRGRRRGARLRLHVGHPRAHRRSGATRLTQRRRCRGAGDAGRHRVRDLPQDRRLAAAERGHRGLSAHPAGYRRSRLGRRTSTTAIEWVPRHRHLWQPRGGSGTPLLVTAHRHLRSREKRCDPVRKPRRRAQIPQPKRRR